MRHELPAALTARQASAVESRRGPVEIDLALLKHVVGGSPKGGWIEPEMSSPKGGWIEPASSSPKGGWEA